MSDFQARELVKGVLESQQSTIQAYEDVLHQENLAQIKLIQEREKLLGVELDSQLKAIEQELRENLEELKPLKERIATKLREEAIEAKKNIPGELVTCQYVQGSWKIEDIDGLLKWAKAKTHSGVMRFLTKGDPTTRIMPNKGKK